MLTTDRTHAVSVVLVSSTVVWLIGVMILAAALASIWRSRLTMMAGLRTRLGAIEGVPQPATA
jgi:hypothetical protein